MLFLAVFCGFLAENQREHYVEVHRAKEYAKSLSGDLKEDTAEIRGGILQNVFMIKAFDSCILSGLNNIDKPTVPGTVYYYSRFTTNAYSIDWNKSTLAQFIQSGNLRIFKNKGLVDKINNYHSMQGRIISNNEQDFVYRNEIAFIRGRLLSAKLYEPFAGTQISEEMKQRIPDKRIDSPLTQQLPLRTGSAGILDEFINILTDRKARNKSYVDELYPEALKMAEELIELIKAEYHFE
jgi:hypothetical protein